MSLRLRLVLSIAFVMVATMMLGVLVVIWNGRHQVNTELAAALVVANESIRSSDVFWPSEGCNPQMYWIWLPLLTAPIAFAIGGMVSSDDSTASNALALPQPLAVTMLNSAARPRKALIACVR